jgi:hypothetical protein
LMIELPNREIQMRRLVGSIAVAAGVALSIGGFVSATQAVEFHGLQVAVPGSGEIRFGNTQMSTSSTSVYNEMSSPHPHHPVSSYWPWRGMPGWNATSSA